LEIEGNGRPFGISGCVGFVYFLRSKWGWFPETSPFYFSLVVSVIHVE
jgi:hypothetical protein